MEQLENSPAECKAANQLAKNAAKSKPGAPTSSKSGNRIICRKGRKLPTLNPGMHLKATRHCRN
jgi:hypothetical protein